MTSNESRRAFFRRALLLIGACTVLLTASFVGILAILSGEIQSISVRAPWYLVIAAGVFVGTIILLEEGGADGGTIMISALLFGLLGFAMISLAIEGILYAIAYPELVFVSQLVLYFFAAGLIGTGVGYWALNHWREFSESAGTA